LSSTPGGALFADTFLELGRSVFSFHPACGGPGNRFHLRNVSVLSATNALVARQCHACFYGTTLFVLLSEIMKRGFATYLTKTRGEKWIKEIDYLYLLVAAVGVIGSLNRIDFLTGRFERADIVAPLLLASAIIIRLLKTRAEIGGWNKPEFQKP
jgi:hypothetical protein